MQVLLIFSLIIAILAVLFAVQNNDPVTISFLFWSWKSSSALVLMIAVLAGVLISLFASLPAMARDKWGIRGHRKKNTELEASLNEYKVKLAEAQQKNADLEKALAAAKELPEAKTPEKPNPTPNPG
jgi:lipopolysaccharide assembly protein A